MTGKTMYSKKQFTALEVMCREQATLARSEMGILANEILAGGSGGMEDTQYRSPGAQRTTENH
jgi:hypothetical protein